MPTPTRAFPTNPNVEKALPDPDCFRLALSAGGVQLGWLGQDSGEWAQIVSDRNHALVLESYPYGGVHYYRIKGSSRYLSVSRDGQVGFYNWVGATGFLHQGSHLVSDYMHQKLSYKSPADPHLFALDSAIVLDVGFEAVKPHVIPNQPLTDLIEHVVVVMLENRSFDNMLGGLYPAKSKDLLYRGLKGNESIPLDPSNPGKGSVAVFQSPPGEDGTRIMPYPDPGELFDDMNEQLFGTAHPAHGAKATMEGFAWNYSKQQGAPLGQGQPPVAPEPRNIMQYYHEESVPMTSFLAKQYAVCDGWFASGPVQTLANRVFAHCGTPGLKPGTNESRVNNPDFTKGMWQAGAIKPPVQDKTIFELLDQAYPGEANWKVYYHDAPISALCSYVYANWRYATPDSGNVYHFNELLPGSVTNFEYDIEHNRLPKYSFIEPRYTDFFHDGPVNSAHPGGAGIDFKDPNGNSLPPAISVKDGEAFLKTVYDILCRHPETFRKTLLIVTYDEHGGLYDHIAPPAAVSPFAKPVDNFAFDRYGVRVPALFINPCIAPGTIYPPRAVADAEHYDHTSLISTICAQFGLANTLSPRSQAAPVIRDLIPADARVYPRPPSPAVAGTLHAGISTVPVLDVAAAMAVLEQQEQPHGLAGALVPMYPLSALKRLKVTL